MLTAIQYHNLKEMRFLCSAELTIDMYVCLPGCLLSSLLETEMPKTWSLSKFRIPADRRNWVSEYYEEIQTNSSACETLQLFNQNTMNRTILLDCQIYVIVYYLFELIAQNSEFISAD
jgi:hypothetical protein